MKPDYDLLQRRLATGSASYVQLARRLTLGSGLAFSEAVPMEGYDTVFVDCTAFVANGTGEPLLAIYVQASNSPRLPFTSLPVGAPVPLEILAPGHYKLDHTVVGQISAAFVRLLYVGDADTVAIIGVGLGRKRIGI